MGVLWVCFAAARHVFGNNDSLFCPPPYHSNNILQSYQPAVQHHLRVLHWGHLSSHDGLQHVRYLLRLYCIRRSPAPANWFIQQKNPVFSRIMSGTHSPDGAFRFITLSSTQPHSQSNTQDAAVCVYTEAGMFVAPCTTAAVYWTTSALRSLFFLTLHLISRQLLVFLAPLKSGFYRRRKLCIEKQNV